MKKIRIGNDVAVIWTLVNKEDQTPFPVMTDAQVFLTNGYTKIPMDYTVTGGNVISLSFLGKDQKLVGEYDLLYVENEGEDNMISFDTKRAFELVPHSWHETGDDTEGVVTYTVEVTSEVATGSFIRDFDEIIIDCGTATRVID